ncbi:hypothetical protein SARC_01600 [Sphaeroforma arctica JP610]|uniref:Uncharacterized protein n=1 Tax=Sphaeroforma arctica JP610 TaxID=667725 RepID=A0A0L0GDF1_9EUKA|nr:hypothetical protein SARC_01600 [Sphaeroforma arctica JP610]KNC86278.1 hypothetical protein SARC_01600 [Sphaeroforma arctica JP610]|eukprot:XP_014160180.1 hypothetical protein SARC_01600 [Sphaeroforma arctica JP610]
MSYYPEQYGYSAPISAPSEGQHEDTHDRGMLKKLAVAGAVAGAGMIAYKMYNKRKRVKQYRTLPDGTTREVFVEVDADNNDPEAYDVDDRGVPVDPNVRAKLEWEDSQNHFNYNSTTPAQMNTSSMPNMYGVHPAQSIGYQQYQQQPVHAQNGYGVQQGAVYQTQSFQSMSTAHSAMLPPGMY